MCSNDSSLPPNSEEQKSNLRVITGGRHNAELWASPEEFQAQVERWIKRTRDVSSSDLIYWEKLCFQNAAVYAEIRRRRQGLKGGGAA